MPVRSPLLPIAESRGAPPRSIRDLVAVLYRQAGLIALCALVGAGASLVAALRQPHSDVDSQGKTSAQVRVAETPAPPVEAGFAQAGDGLRLDLDLDPGPLGEGRGAMAAVVALAALAPGPRLRLDFAGADSRDDVDLHARPLAMAGASLGLARAGLIAGLLLGLVLAGARELGGARMRTPRQAQWALGAPVLGAIPTLSAKARNTCFEPPLAALAAGPAALA